MNHKKVIWWERASKFYFALGCAVILLIASRCVTTKPMIGNCQEKAFIQASIATREGKDVVVARGWRVTPYEEGWHVQAKIKDGKWLENVGLRVYEGSKDSGFTPQEHMTFEGYLEHLLKRVKFKKEVLGRE